MCSKGLAKFLLITSNIIILIAGVALFAFGIVAKVDPGAFSSFASGLSINVKDKVDVGEILENSADLMITVGVIVFIFAFLGCFGGLFEISWMLLTYWIALLIVIILEIGVIIYIAAFPGEFHKTSLAVVYKGFSTYKPETFYSNDTIKAPADPNSLYWYGIQMLLQCCGVKSYMDYDNLKGWNRTYKIHDHYFQAKVPPTCCLGKDPDEALHLDELESCMTKTNATLHDIGCFNALENEFQRLAYILVAITILIILLQLVSIVSAIYLWRLNRSGHKAI